MQTCTSIKRGCLTDEKQPQVHSHLAGTYSSIITYRYIQSRHCRRETSSADFWAHCLPRHGSHQARPHPPELSGANLSGNHPSPRSPERSSKPSALQRLSSSSKLSVPISTAIIQVSKLQSDRQSQSSISRYLESSRRRPIPAYTDIIPKAWIILDLYIARPSTEPHD